MPIGRQEANVPVGVQAHKSKLHLRFVNCFAVYILSQIVEFNYLPCLRLLPLRSDFEAAVKHQIRETSASVAWNSWTPFSMRLNLLRTSIRSCTPVCIVGCFRVSMYLMALPCCRCPYRRVKIFPISPRFVLCFSANTSITPSSNPPSVASTNKSRTVRGCRPKRIRKTWQRKSREGSSMVRLIQHAGARYSS